jgi:hypothetical protein
MSVLIALLCVGPLLCDDREIGKYTRPVSRQRFDKHFSEATNRPATIEVLTVGNGLFLRGPFRGGITQVGIATGYGLDD